MTACANPIPFETLVALWTGELPDQEAALEEHLFSCDECAQAFERFAKLAIGLREFIPPVLSHAHRDRLVAQGARICNTPVEANRPVRARFAPELDLLVHVLRADLSDAERVDVEAIAPDASWRFLFELVPFDRTTGEVLIACQRHFETMFPGDPTFRLFAVSAGQRKHLGDYRVEHIWR
jgi:hypothetical protein